MDPILRDKDGGTAELRADSTQVGNPVLAAFETAALDNEPGQDDGMSPASPTASQLEDEEEEMREVTRGPRRRAETTSTSISDRQRSELHYMTQSCSVAEIHVGGPGVSTSASALVSQSTTAWDEREAQWRSQKEANMRQSEQYREEKLTLEREKVSMEREKVRMAKFESKMRTAEMLRKADPNLDWDDALRKATVLMNND